VSLRAGVVAAALLLLSLAAAGRAAAAGDVRSAPGARDEARRILAERRFHASRPPQPLRPVLSAIGHAAERVAHALRPLWHPFVSLAELFPLGMAAFWLVLGALVVVAAAYLFRSLARRRDRRVLVAEGRAGPSAGDDPAAMERAAERAEATGELELALRLRFRAGVLRLQRARVVPPGGLLTSRELSRRLGSREFDLAAAVFDEVVYGRRPAQPVDVATTREAWQQVLRAAQAR
jgi:hypothetical protein